MAQSKDLRERVDQIIERSEKELLRASHKLAVGIDREAKRVVPPASADLERVVDNVFDFAENVIQGQRRMVKDVMKALNEQVDRAAEEGRRATKEARKHVATRRHARHHGARGKASGAKRTGTRTPSKRPSAAKATGTRKAAAKRTPAARKSVARSTAARAPADGRVRAR
jgi:hypothetical protein